MYKRLIRPLLFRFDAERVHHGVFALVGFLFKIPFVPALFRRACLLEDPRLEREVFGLKFRNPVGIAAGFDKNAELTDELAAMGFGFVEIGTLTPRPQPGNDKPRLFRLRKDQALINRLGFNNRGTAAAVKKLAGRQSDIVIGGNIGKNKATPNDEAVADYLASFDALYEVVDYFAVNVSSPNTPNLRALQEKEPLRQLLAAIQARNQTKPHPKPVLLKIAPDLTNGQLDDIIDIVLATRIAGVIATNTTVDRNALETGTDEVTAIGAGGLSGRPLAARATEVIRYLHRQSNGAFPIIGVGGILSPRDALDKLAAGASLVQLYTGFVYEGPTLAKRINRALLDQEK
ncbi:MAG: quinone-dependent dihydroorotate dehydrogenase [Ferruginibacter sp.]|nr:quinone-dependent dihydroorotate dehydrogenase [Cytophagales bacterium]